MSTIRAIKIPVEVDDLMSVVEIPSGFPAINEAVLGDKNRLIEEVHARGLQSLFDGMPAVVMLVDEEGLLVDEPELNQRASLLYGTHVHRQPIMGPVVIVATDGEDWVNLPESITPETVANAMLDAINNPEMFR